MTHATLAAFCGSLQYGATQAQLAFSALKTLRIQDALAEDDFDDLLIVDPYQVHAPSRRSDKDLANLLSLIDSLETANDRKEITK